MPEHITFLFKKRNHVHILGFYKPTVTPYTHTHTHTYIHIHTHTHSHAHTHTHIHTFTYAHTHIHTHTHAHTHTYTHTIHAHTHTHTCTHTQYTQFLLVSQSADTAPVNSQGAAVKRKPVLLQQGNNVIVCSIVKLLRAIAVDGFR